MTFSDYIDENRERLGTRAAEIRHELYEIEAELAAIAAYEKAKRRDRRISPTDAETMSVPEAGRHFLGLSESASWVAWRRGDIPAFKAGRYRRVPVAEMRKRLEGRAAAPRSKVREEEGYPGSLVPVRE